MSASGRNGKLRGPDFPSPAPFPDDETGELIDAYHAADTRAKVLISENLGERAGLWFLRTVSGDHDMEIQDAEQEPVEDDRVCAPGEMWDRPVTFSGSGVANMVWWDGETLWVVECKGGGSGLGERKIRYNPQDPEYEGQYCDQGTEDYIRELPGAANENTQSQDGRVTVGTLIQESYEDGNLRYVKANCGGYAKLKKTGDEGQVRDLGLVNVEDFHLSGKWSEQPHEQPRKKATS